MVKHTQTIRWQIADKLFECIWPFCGIGAERVKICIRIHAHAYCKLTVSIADCKFEEHILQIFASLIVPSLVSKKSNKLNNYRFFDKAYCK